MELDVKVYVFLLPWLLWLSQSEVVLCNKMFTSLALMRGLVEKEDIIKNIFHQYLKSGTVMRFVSIIFGCSVSLVAVPTRFWNLCRICNVNKLDRTQK